MTALEFHPLADIFPLVEGRQAARALADKSGPLHHCMRRLTAVTAGPWEEKIGTTKRISTPLVEPLCPLSD
jgi:hypothetical protein